MTLTLTPPEQPPELKPRIIVFGVGGAGGNAVNNMIRSNLEGVECVVANTDAQALNQCLAERKIQLGLGLTQGLGAGSRPEVGRAAAEEGMEEIISQVSGGHMVFVTAGMGGGTGTGAAPVIAGAAREQGLLTVGVVTKPFHFEGSHRMDLADKGIVELAKVVDTLIVIPNQNLFRVANEKTTFTDAFQMADEVLYAGVRGVTELMISPGLINLDFADIRAIMDDGGKAMMGSGEADGESRALAAAEAAIANPLLEDSSLSGARGCLINITGGPDLTLYEVDEAANRIRDEVDPSANIIFGSVLDESLEGRMRVSIFATGVDAAAAPKQPASSAAGRPAPPASSGGGTPPAGEPAPPPGGPPTGDVAASDVAAGEAAASEAKAGEVTASDMAAGDPPAVSVAEDDSGLSGILSFDQSDSGDSPKAASSFSVDLDDLPESDGPAAADAAAFGEPVEAASEPASPAAASPVRISPAASRSGAVEAGPAEPSGGHSAKPAHAAAPDIRKQPTADRAGAGTGAAPEAPPVRIKPPAEKAAPADDLPPWPEPEAGQPDMFAERKPAQATFGEDPGEPASDLPDPAVSSNRSLRQALMGEDPEPRILEGPDETRPARVVREEPAAEPEPARGHKRSFLSRLVGRTSDDRDDDGRDNEGRGNPAAPPKAERSGDHGPRFGAQFGQPRTPETDAGRNRSIVPPDGAPEAPAASSQTIVLDRGARAQSADPAPSRPAAPGGVRAGDPAEKAAIPPAAPPTPATPAVPPAAATPPSTPRAGASFVPPDLDAGDRTAPPAGRDAARPGRETATASEDDMLEIPAFLRRQSN